MRLAAPVKASPSKTEQIILFRVSGQLFAVSSASVQEVRSADSMSGAAAEISAPGLRKDDDNDAAAGASTLFLSRRTAMVPRSDGSRPGGRASSASGRVLVARRTGFARCGSF